MCKRITTADDVRLSRRRRSRRIARSFHLVPPGASFDRRRPAPVELRPDPVRLGEVAPRARAARRAASRSSTQRRPARRIRRPAALGHDVEHAVRSRANAARARSSAADRPPRRSSSAFAARDEREQRRQRLGRVEVVEQRRLDRRLGLVGRRRQLGRRRRVASPSRAAKSPTRRTASIDASSASSDRLSCFR